MGNLACCVSKPATGPGGVEEDTKIHQILEEDRKRNIDEGLRNMANGGHQLIAGFTAPHVFKREPGKSYYPFNWGSEGSVPITSFGVKIVASGNDVQFVEGLANYATFMCSWKPDNKEGHLLITLDNYKSVDANTGEETPVNTPPKKFLVDREGNFVGIVNLDELVNEAVEQAVAVAGGQDDKTEEQKQELKKILMQQRDVMVKGVVGDVSLMWRCWVQVWTHEERIPNEETDVYGFKCVRRKKVLGSDAEENKQTLRKFYDDLFDNLNKSSQGSVAQDKSPSNGKKKSGGRDNKERQSQSSFRPEVILEQAKQLEVYNALFVSDGVRCHQSSYRKFTESSITIQGENTERAEFEGKRWVFGWRDIPMLSSRAYMVSLFSEYATVAGAFHDALQEKYNDNADHNIFNMLVSHPFVTEPNEEVIKADKDKQKIAAMNQMAGGAHSMFSGLSPPIKYEERTNPSSYYQFAWPGEGQVKVYALGFTIKITDGEAKFTQGLGTFITFVVRWQPAQLEGHTDVFLENNVLIVAATGAEEPLPEPVKHILVDRSGSLVKVVNMDQLVSYAVDTAIQQKGNITDEEKKSYRDMLEKTQKETLTKAVECDLSFIWASWVQMWVHQQKGAHAEHDAFGKTCVTLERSNESSPEENKKTVLSLINSVLGEEKKNEFEIKVEVAKQSERYKTVFEKDTLRPHDAKYEKITETVLSFGSHQVHQKEFKNSCHVFIWQDIPKLATKEYATAVYQNYLNLANNMYDELRPSATPQ